MNYFFLSWSRQRDKMNVKRDIVESYFPALLSFATPMYMEITHFLLWYCNFTSPPIEAIAAMFFLGVLDHIKSGYCVFKYSYL